jgi:hypothetical protein
MTKSKTVLKLDVKKSKVKLNNLNLNINFTYLDDTTVSKDRTEGKGSVCAEVKKNLFPLLHDITYTDDNEIEKLICIQKPKYGRESKRASVEIVQQEETLEDKLNYIFDKEKNVKNELRKVKPTNSCKCGKTNCSKYYCNCLRNGIKCDILCTCTNCSNVNGDIILLNKKHKK